MDKRSRKVEKLPFALAQISPPARKHLKILAASLLQYHKDLPAKDPEVFPPERNKEGSVYGGTLIQTQR
jgi:hypothetical protein